LARIPDIVTPLKTALAMYRLTERGVKLFNLFVVLFVVGLLLMLAGRPFPAALCGLLALVSLLAMASSTPPHVLERRLAEAEAAEAASSEGVKGEGGMGAVSDVKSGRDEDGRPVTTGRARSKLDALSLEAGAAPTSRRREIKPPPEVPLEVVTMEEGGGSSTEDGGEGGDEEIWV
jgi:hypothetical protein